MSPPPKPVYGGNFSHEAMTLKTRSRSPTSNKLFILSELYRLANLVTFHPMVHEITCRQTLFDFILWTFFCGEKNSQIFYKMVFFHGTCTSQRAMCIFT